MDNGTVIARVHKQASYVQTWAKEDLPKEVLGLRPVRANGGHTKASGLGLAGSARLATAPVAAPRRRLRCTARQVAQKRSGLVGVSAAAVSARMRAHHAATVAASERHARRARSAEALEARATRASTRLLSEG